MVHRETRCSAFHLAARLHQDGSVSGDRLATAADKKGLQRLLSTMMATRRKLKPLLALILIGSSVLAGCGEEDDGGGTVAEDTIAEGPEVFEAIPERDRSTSGLGALVEFLASGEAEPLSSITREQLDTWGIPNAGELPLEDPWDSYPISPFIPVLLPEDYEGDLAELEEMLSSLTYEDFRDDPTGFYETLGLDLTSDEVAELVTEFAESPEFEALAAAEAPFRPSKTWPC